VTTDYCTVTSLHPMFIGTVSKLYEYIVNRMPSSPAMLYVDLSVCVCVCVCGRIRHRKPAHKSVSSGTRNRSVYTVVHKKKPPIFDYNFVNSQQILM